MSERFIEGSLEQEWDLKRPLVMVNEENRRDSFSSEELDTAIDNSVMDSINFGSTMYGGPEASKTTASTASSQTKAQVPGSVKALILASTALRKTEGPHRCVYTLRRLALYFAKLDGVCATNGEFAKIYKAIELPGQLSDPEPEYGNDLPGQEYVQYAHSRAKEALEALRAAGLDKDEEV